MINSPPYWNNLDIIQFPKSVILATDLSDSVKITLAFLLTYSDRDEIWISQGRIAEERGLSDGTINQHFLRLEKNGYIILKRKSGYSSQVLFTTQSLPSVLDSED